MVQPYLIVVAVDSMSVLIADEIADVEMFLASSYFDYRPNLSYSAQHNRLHLVNLHKIVPYAVGYSLDRLYHDYLNYPIPVVVKISWSFAEIQHVQEIH